MLDNIPKSEDYIKGRIFEEIKRENYEDAYVLLKGLLKLEESKDIYEKLILILENLRQKDKMYKEEELNIIERAKNRRVWKTIFTWIHNKKKIMILKQPGMLWINTYQWEERKLQIL